MTRTEYYKEMQTLARETRRMHNITSLRVLRADMRRIYKALGIQIDLWPHRLKGIRGAYFSGDGIAPSVMLCRSLPIDPMVFTMAHELKHHLVDGEVSYCSDGNVAEMKEIGAEVFAAEFIFPVEEFLSHLRDRGVTPATFAPETLVRLKRDTQTTLSYTGLAKRAVWTKFAAPGSLDGIRWKKLEENIYGEPLYRRLWRDRRNRSS